MASAARRPASEAPMTTTGASGISASALDGDRRHRAGARRLLDELALRLVHLFLPHEHVVVAQIKDVGSHEHALSVALAEVHVHVDLHALLSFAEAEDTVSTPLWRAPTGCRSRRRVQGALEGAFENCGDVRVPWSSAREARHALLARAGRAVASATLGRVEGGVGGGDQRGARRLRLPGGDADAHRHVQWRAT